MGGDHHHHRLGIALQYLASQWKPSAALVAPRPKLASSRITSAAPASIDASASSGAWKVATSLEQVAQQQPRRQQDVRIVVDDQAAPNGFPLTTLFS
jgi:hypothetical protein